MGKKGREMGTRGKSSAFVLCFAQRYNIRGLHSENTVQYLKAARLQSPLAIYIMKKSY